MGGPSSENAPVAERKPASSLWLEPPRWARWSGPALALVVVIVLVLGTRRAPGGALQLTGMTGVLVLVVGFSALSGGTLMGLLSTLILVGFVVLATSPGGYSGHDVDRLLALALTLPLMALSLGYIRQRLARGALHERALRTAADAEHALRERILESITDGFFAVDREWRYTYVNREAERLVGRTRDELLGRVVWDEFPPLVGSRWDKEYHRAVEDQASVHFESFYPPLAAWFETHAYPSEDGLAIFLRSVDERKRAEDSLRIRARQQASIAMLGERALAGMDLAALFDLAVHTVAGTLEVEYAKVLELLPGGSDMLLRAGAGWRSGFVGRHLVSVAGSQAGYTLATSQPVVVDDTRTETRFTVPELLAGHDVTCGVSVVIPGSARAFGVLGAHARTTRKFSEEDCDYLRSVANVLGAAIARKDSEEEIQASEARFRQIADNIREVFFVIDRNPPRFVYISPAYEAISGFPRAPLYEAPLSWLESVHPDDRPYVQRALFAQDTEAFEGEFRIVRADGAVRWIRDRLFPVRDGGSSYRSVGVAEDVTERKAAEEAARQLAAAEARISARDEVLAMVTHDLRSPLGSVLTSAKLLEGALPEERRERYLGVIRRAVERMNRLVQDLLDVSRIEAGRFAIAPGPVEIARVVAEIVDGLQAQADDKLIQLVAEAPDGHATVWADRARLLQVLANLVGNALKFTPEGGRIVVRAEPAEGTYVRFSVADTGPGLVPEQAAHVFDRFWQASTTDRRGAGLGLAIAKGIVEAHHGAIGVSSEPGAGSTFSFTVPTAPPQAA